MLAKKLTQIGHPLIRTKTKAVKNPLSPEIQKLLKTMTKALRKFHLVGIAANQIGVNAQIFLTEIRSTKLRKKVDKTNSLRVFINPKIIAASKKETELVEGCGSLAHAGLFGPVRRPHQVTVEALNEKGERFTLTAKGLLAKVIQHEFDHLHGVSIIDKFVDAKRVSARENL